MTTDLVTSPWTTAQHEDGHSRFKLAQIGVAVTTPGRDELERLDVTIRRSPSSKLVHAAASTAGINKKEIGLDKFTPVSYELAERRHGEFLKTS